MAIRNIIETDYKSLASLMKSFFSVHNQFQKPDNLVIKYLKEQAKLNELIVYDYKGAINGALYLVTLHTTLDRTHTLWKFRHFAFDSEDIGKNLLDHAEKIVKKSSRTSKIELTIAETEPGMNFYKSNGYEVEGMLSNHYRWGENTYILSKSFLK